MQPRGGKIVGMITNDRPARPRHGDDMTTEHQDQEGPGKGSVRPSGGPGGLSGGACLEKACEALTQAHSALQGSYAPETVDRLITLAAEWRHLGDSVHAVDWEREHRGSLERFDGPLERVARGVEGGTLGEGPGGSQTGAQGFEPRTVELPSGRTVHLWRGEPYVEDDILLTVRLDGSAAESAWKVQGVNGWGVPILMDGFGYTELLDTLLERYAPFVPRNGHPRVGETEYPIGSMWADVEDDLWIVDHVGDDGEPYLLEMDMLDDPDGSPVRLADILDEYKPLTRTSRTS